MPDSSAAESMLIVSFCLKDNVGSRITPGNTNLVMVDDAIVQSGVADPRRWHAFEIPEPICGTET